MTDTAVLLPDRAAVATVRGVVGRTRQLFEIRDAGGDPDWCPADAGDAFGWETAVPPSGAKRFFFPPAEPVLRWNGGGIVAVLPEPSPFALFGLHPCDAAAIVLQDRVFAGDEAYGRRRRAAFLVVLDCATACAGGFCRDVATGPFAAGGFDLALTPLNDGRVVVTAGTAAGREVLAQAGLRPIAEAVDARTAARTAADASFPVRPPTAAALARIDAVDGTAVSDAEWDAIGASCLACTGCTSVCPTCSCFAVVDAGDGLAGERQRLWDSCLLHGFQREAGDHHPNPRPGDRVRRFWQHKLSRQHVPVCGALGCVGCGRCDVTCPGRIGALRVLDRLGAPR